MQGARTCLLASRSLGMRRTQQYVAMIKDEAQRRSWTFYEAVKIRLISCFRTPYYYIGVF